MIYRIQQAHLFRRVLRRAGFRMDATGSADPDLATLECPLRVGHLSTRIRPDGGQVGKRSWNENPIARVKDPYFREALGQFGLTAQ